MRTQRQLIDGLPPWLVLGNNGQPAMVGTAPAGGAISSDAATIRIATQARNQSACVDLSGTGRLRTTSVSLSGARWEAWAVTEHVGDEGVSAHTPRAAAAYIAASAGSFAFGCLRCAVPPGSLLTSAKKLMRSGRSRSPHTVNDLQTRHVTATDTRTGAPAAASSRTSG